MFVSLVVLAGLVGYGSGHVTLNNPEANSVAETAENKTIVYAPCPITCKCGYNENGWISKATCRGSDPAVLLAGAQFIQELAVSDCSGQLGNVNLTSEEVGGIERLSLFNCPLEPENLDMYKVFTSLRRLVIEGNEPEQVDIGCRVLQNLEHLGLSNNGLTISPVNNCTLAPFLRSIDFSRNSFTEFELDWIDGWRELVHLDLSANLLTALTPASNHLPLTKLKLNRNPDLRSLCSTVFHSMPNIRQIDISGTGLKLLPLGLLQLQDLTNLTAAGLNLNCDCQTTLRLTNHPRKELFERLECSSPVSGTKFLISNENHLDSLECGEATIEGMSEDAMVLVGEETILNCPVSEDANHETFWLTPRGELLRLFQDGGGTCPAFQDTLELTPTVKDYSIWRDHYTVLENGSLRIDEYGWRDRGTFVCYVDNGVSNSSESVNLRLNHNYRNRVYYLSLAFGFGGAACFLMLTMLGKLLYYLLWNYGCCLCCSCCKNQLPPKTKKLTKVVDSIETYRIQQLEKLRENYTMQSQRIRDNCSFQMERVRENYNNQVKGIKDMKSYGSAQCAGVKDNYYDQISKIREYSTGQLDKCHENYIFQRQRLRKFSAQNYLKIRETKKYTQKTLNRVLDNMPALYLDLSSCKQGIGDTDLRDWQDEMDRREIEMKECLEINPEMGLGDTDSTSVYFTPSGTPMRDLSSLKGTPQREFNEMYGGVYSPTRGDGSPEKGGGKGRGHRRMVSNLSNFLPFWWGMNQGTVETVAIVENTDRQQRDDEDASTTLLHNNTEDNTITTDVDTSSPSDTSASTTTVCETPRIRAPPRPRLDSPVGTRQHSPVRSISVEVDVTPNQMRDDNTDHDMPTTGAEKLMACAPLATGEDDHLVGASAASSVDNLYDEPVPTVSSLSSSEDIITNAASAHDHKINNGAIKTSAVAGLSQNGTVQSSGSIDSINTVVTG